jgi:hypothetical protein
VGDTDSLLTAGLVSGDAARSDCANAGRAIAAIKNNSKKLIAAIDRVSGLSGISIWNPVWINTGTSLWQTTTSSPFLSPAGFPTISSVGFHPRQKRPDRAASA